MARSDEVHAVKSSRSGAAIDSYGARRAQTGAGRAILQPEASLHGQDSTEDALGPARHHWLSSSWIWSQSTAWHADLHSSRDSITRHPTTSDAARSKPLNAIQRPLIV
jgi:hypothetical protein